MLSFQKETPKGYHSWFGFPIIVKDNAPFNSRDLRDFLESKGIETRPIIAGNIAKQPALEMFDHRVSGELKNSTHVMDNGLAVACHQSLGEDSCEYITKMFDLFFLNL